MAAGIDHEEVRDTSLGGLLLSLDNGQQVFGAQADLGAWRSWKVSVVVGEERRIGIYSSAEIGVASLGGNLTWRHAKVRADDGVKTKRRVNLRIWNLPA